MQYKFQMPLLLVNVGVLAVFMGGVAYIMHNEHVYEEMLKADSSGDLRCTVPRPDGLIAGGIEETQTVVDVHVTTLDSSAESGKSEKAEKDEKACEERSLMVPIIVAFLAGGIINLPELSALPCI